MVKKPLCILLGITGDMGFAAGSLLRGLRRHNPSLEADIRIYTDGMLPAADAALLRGHGAELLPYTAPAGAFRPGYLQLFSALTLARMEAFLLLEHYSRVLWLDADMAVQDDIADILAYGPMGVSELDPSRPDPAGFKAGTNAVRDVPGLDGDAPQLCAAPLLLADTLPGTPESLYRFCMDWMCGHADALRYADMAALNMFAQHLQRQNPEYVRIFPYERFNAHPYNPKAQYAVMVHAFGLHKMWADGLISSCFPEWARDYRYWTESGGTPYRGTVHNEQYAHGGILHTVARLSEYLESTRNLLQDQQRLLGLRRKTGGR